MRRNLTTSPPEVIFFVCLADLVLAIDHCPNDVVDELYRSSERNGDRPAFSCRQWIRDGQGAERSVGGGMIGAVAVQILEEYDVKGVCHVLRAEIGDRGRDGSGDRQRLSIVYHARCVQVADGEIDIRLRLVFSFRAQPGACAGGRRLCCLGFDPQVVGLQRIRKAVRHRL
jgi:hypothetical protein